jgi:hypothetical protein
LDWDDLDLDEPAEIVPPPFGGVEDGPLLRGDLVGAEPCDLVGCVEHQMFGVAVVVAPDAPVP